MRKHEYEEVGEAVLTIVGENGDFVFPKFQCKHCGDVLLLDWWQLKEMPRSTAACPSSPVKSTWREWLYGAYDCVAKEDTSPVFREPDYEDMHPGAADFHEERGDC